MSTRGGKRPGAGRPPSADARGCSVRVRLTASEQERLQRLARESQQSVSEYVRWKVFGA